MMTGNVSRALLVLLLTPLLFACATHPPVERSIGVSEAQLLDGARLGVGPDQHVESVSLIAVNDDMRAFLREHVPDDAGDLRKVELILGAILQDGLQLSYNNFKTYTAQEAFYSREGNCMSFTSLFVALAREAGVDVVFQEVEVPPTWSERGESWLYNLHINAVVDIPGGQQVVDFSLENYSSEYRRQPLGDAEALARYHSNMGVHWMSEGDPRQAFLHLKRSLELSDQRGFVWSNLGTLYRRGGDLEAAEAAYLKAVALDNEPSANSNLARLYRQLGQAELAAYYKNRVQMFRRKNPYYLFHLAEEAYARADYDEAATLLRTAIRRDGKEHQFHRLLGLVYTREGDLGAARRSFERAVALAEGREKENYNHKLELLAGAH
ncbi:tetratricopeptide repeat protein [Parahaliea mediterranea]|uniref:Tetratricopeptide repeat protein n=1 Tax=Parahaliea mediterranea TaxID=651086 RepID=A0A939DJ19_9GAMM|nr:tetratricopeptide repeat protein [Parahaliea mediterranea]MBN7799014.1 tetratricopeptide repeat protein [Parahaliea mediterranea]